LYYSGGHVVAEFLFILPSAVPDINSESLLQWFDNFTSVVSGNVIMSLSLKDFSHV